MELLSTLFCDRRVLLLHLPFLLRCRGVDTAAWLDYIGKNVKILLPCILLVA